MNHLAKHIEALIWQHECIIVPQFGGFVTQVQCAYTTDAGNSIMPPVRTVGFNDKLLGNDGILVQSYKDVYNLSETDAKRLLQTDILEMRELLLHRGSYDLGRLGRLEQDEDGEIHFIPKNSYTAPEFYGLEAVDFPLLPQETEPVQIKEPAAALPPSPESDSKEEKEHITLNINRRALHTALSVAAAILLFFLVSTPVNTNLWNQNEAILAQDILNSALQFMPRMETKETPVSITQNDTISTKIQETQEKPQPVTLSEEYAVVVASAIPEKNAHSFVEHLQQKGIEGATVYKHGAMVRVLFRGFPTESDARKKMQALQSVPELQSAWILQMK